MATNANIRAAEALYASLSVFHSIAGQQLRAVRQIYTQGCLEKIVFDFGSIFLLAIADPNDDSIDFKVASASDAGTLGGDDASSIAPWVGFIGKRFGWGWIAISQQGYCDGLLLSFDEVVFPELALTVVASSIKVGTITKFF